MRRNRLKGILALCIMTLALTAMYLYLTYGQQAFSTKAVLVAGVDIEPGTIINPQLHFIQKNIKNEDLIPGSVSPSNITAIEGMAAAQFIPKNGQVNNRSFEKAGIVITGDKFVFKTPNDWIYAVPSSIRRGDSILIYGIDSKIDKAGQLGNETVSSDNQEVLSTYQGAPDIERGELSPIMETAVIYVKDSANREVVDVDGKGRLDATSQVASIEIVCNKDNMEKLENKIAEGKKLILVYR